MEGAPARSLDYLLSADNSHRLFVTSSATECWSLALETRFNAIARASANDLHILKALDDDFAALHAAISTIHWQRYNMAPISRLPFELLAYVFSILSVEEPPHLPAAKYHGTKLGWLRMLHVCNRWRQVTLAMPAFSSRFVLHKRKLVWIQITSVDRPFLSQIALEDMPIKSNQVIAADKSAIDYWNHVLQTRISTSVASPENLNGFQAFDDELAAYHTAIAAVYRRRNHFAPISRLSSHLLSTIFLVLAANEPTRSDLHEPRHVRFGWIKVSHVCSRWRQVTLETPMLWAHVVFDLGYQWALQSVERARHAPLIINHSAWKSIYKLPNKPAINMPVELVSPSLMSHTVALNLSGDYAVLSDVLTSLVSPVPILECIDLAIYGRDNSLRLPEGLFSHHAPNLCEASFEGLKIPWCSPALRHLTSLSVTFSQFTWHDNPSILPSRDELLDALSGMPFLEHLSLVYATPLHSEAVSPRTIILPHLSSLSLEGEWLDGMAVLADIQFPDTATLNLHFECEGDVDKPVDALLHILQKNASGLGNALPLCSMLLHIGATFRVYGWPTTYAHVHPTSTHQLIRLKFSHNEFVRLDAPRETIPAIIRAIDVHKLSTLYLTVTMPSNWDLAATRDALRLAHSLTHVHLSRHAAPLFCELLDPIASPGNTLATQAGSQEVPFPKLQFIHLDYVDMNQTYTTRSETLPILRDLLPRVLEERRRLKAPVQVVDIKECFVSEEWVDQLKNIVPTVTWDAKTQWTVPDDGFIVSEF